MAWNHRSERHLLRPFDVLVTARAGSVQAALVPPQVSRTVAGVTLLVVRAKEPTFGMGHWFWYFLTSTFGQTEITKRLVTSATMKTLSARSLGEMEIPMPTLGALESIAMLVEASEEAFASALRAATLRREMIRDGLVQGLRLNGGELYQEEINAADQPGIAEQTVAGR